jgi:UDP-2,3-diacylglucosamine pyrophosphatase LpxH
MLVFISDLHFTDTTLSATLNPNVFRIFCGLLQDIIERSTPENVKIVLLGDIFDLLRTDYWSKTSLKPWSKPDETDENGKMLAQAAEEITRLITGNKANVEGISYLKKFGKGIATKGIQFDVEYLPGNHDRLLNRFEPAVKVAADFFGIDIPPEGRFITERLWEDHRVYARHGDIYDPINYEGDSKSSIGDAVVIELLSRFSDEIKAEFAENDVSGILEEIGEIDNVRPLLDIPAYVNGVCRKHGGEGAARRVKKIWDRLAGEFAKSSFIAMRDRRFRWDIVNTLKTALFLTRKFSNGHIANVLSNERLRDFFSGDTFLARKASAEKPVKDGKADFVVYGHTHKQAMVPLTGWDGAGTPKESFYFNTGTWRRVFQKAKQGRSKNDFARWNVMTFICIFKEGERVASDGTQRRFEMWTASLG